MRFAHAHHAFLAQCRYYADIGKSLESAALAVITAETAQWSRYPAVRAEALAQCRQARHDLSLTDAALNAAVRAGADLTSRQVSVFHDAENAARREVASLRQTLSSIEMALRTT
ncbi:hypothetical protein [Nocardia sp. NPDC056000]|uniref:hypothetical protein n=1 Tax=Nocardia sp. NPDC056000 TaxID=3345674 RepID=UPI0035E14EDC